MNQTNLSFNEDHNKLNATMHITEKNDLKSLWKKKWTCLNHAKRVDSNFGHMASFCPLDFFQIITRMHNFHTMF